MLVTGSVEFLNNKRGMMLLNDRHMSMGANKLHSSVLYNLSWYSTDGGTQ